MSRTPWARLLIGAGAAVVLALLASQPYPGVTVDSGEYLAVADGLADGSGYTMPYVNYDEAYRVFEDGERIPMTQFPPLYPSLLAALHLVGISLLTSARLLGALAYVGTSVIAGYLVWRHTESRVWTGVTAALIVAPELLTLHAMAWSEPFMVLAMVGALLLTLKYVTEERVRDLIGAGALASLASLSRFAGIAVIFAVTLAIVSAKRWPFRKRLAHAGALLAASATPVALWFVRNASITGAVSEKEPVWHPPGWQHIRPAIETFGSWLIPGPSSVAFVAGLFVVGAGVWITVAGIRSIVRKGATSVPSLCFLFALVYLVFLLLSRTVLDQNIPFDSRLLSPVQVLAVIGVCSVIGSRDRSSLSVPAVGLSVVAILAVVRGTVTAVGFSGSGVAAYSGDEWRGSETLRFAGSLPDGTLFITNAPDPIWLWHGRESLLIPPRSSLYSGKPNENYSAQVEELWARTACEEAVVVFFDQPTRKPPRTIDPLVVHGLRVTEVTSFEDGEALQIAEPTSGC